MIAWTELFEGVSPHSGTTALQSEGLSCVLGPYTSCEEPGMTSKSAGGNGVGNKDMFLWEMRWFLPSFYSREIYTLPLQRKSLYLVYRLGVKAF